MKITLKIPHPEIGENIFSEQEAYIDDLEIIKIVERYFEMSANPIEEVED